MRFKLNMLQSELEQGAGVGSTVISYCSPVQVVSAAHWRSLEAVGAAVSYCHEAEHSLMLLQVLMQVLLQVLMQAPTLVLVLILTHRAPHSLTSRSPHRPLPLHPSPSPFPGRASAFAAARAF